MITLRKDKVLLFDLDGTMYRGNDVIPEAIQFLKNVQAAGMRYLFVTNNAMRTPQQICDKMQKMGFSDIVENDFFTSAMAASAYLKKESTAKRVFMIGEEGLQHALKQQGFTIVDEQADAVVVGLSRTADYLQYCKAMQNLRQGAVFVGTNGDRRLPNGDTDLIGNGAILEMLHYASEVPCILVGKPHAKMMQQVLDHLQVKKEGCVVIGDNLETDIAFGYANGVQTIMVCSGVHQKNDLSRFPSIPDAVVDTLCEIKLIEE